jgi:transcriptional regulator with XRE-family HTH domain
MRKVRSPLPPRVTEALARLGAGLKNLRARRRMPMAYAADRALISRSTLYKVERGDPGVGLGVYATVLQGYGMLERLEGLVDARWDRAGLALEESRLPRRIRSSDV